MTVLLYLARASPSAAYKASDTCQTLGRPASRPHGGRGRNWTKTDFRKDGEVERRMEDKRE